MEFSRQEYWRGLPLPTPGALPDPGMEPSSPVFPALAGGFFTTEPAGQPERFPPQSLTADSEKPEGYRRDKASVWVLAAQFCPAVRDPMDCSPPGSSVRGFLQAGLVVWVPVSFSRGSSRPRDGARASCTAGRFFTIWAATGAHR